MLASRALQEFSQVYWNENVEDPQKQDITLFPLSAESKFRHLTEEIIYDLMAAVPLWDFSLWPSGQSQRERQTRRLLLRCRRCKWRPSTSLSPRPHLRLPRISLLHRPTLAELRRVIPKASTSVALQCL
ncbi:hypothetical protein DACRYDRAFT_95592 [Dacryopinax primogenitus]|uniref:Uncharacterized protein n=1 Tax=Dacryopinax primogenitus (strain DJM 731) TaxID=1858805 RepID=M5G355_DACPD|nr:uncharacterized protein DACRYDRAFT_95592 [Dacryopinax primogenitus]EJU00292.1 hypothetical protein DACRYDRAFT_95592 [Dacryopinax primogenitus]